MQQSQTRRQILKAAGTGFLASLLSGCGQTNWNRQANRRNQPNILLILTDDQGYPTTGKYGGQIVSTPNLDRLASEGMRFTDAYVTPQCTPTRASLLTGQYTARNRMWHVIPWYGYPWARMTEPPYRENLSRDTFTLAKGLRSAGYATGIFGKWHLTSNEDGHYMGLKPEAAHYYGFDFAPPVLSREEFEEGRDRGAMTLTRQALDFIQSKRDRLWFCYLSHHMIHGKVVAPEDLTARYQRQGYDSVGPNRAVYLAGLEQIDRSIGVLLAGLEEMGQAENTLIFFVSDNGGIDERLDFKNISHLPYQMPQFSPDVREYDNEPLRNGKGSIYEGGVRVPFIVRWPGHIKKGQVVGTPVHIVDIAATLLDVAGAEPQHHMDGASLVDLFETGNAGWLRGRAIFQYCPFYDLRWGLTPCASIRKGDYKLIEFFGDRVDRDNRYIPGHHTQLYNLRQDLPQTTNLAQTHPEIARTLRQELHNWMSGLAAQKPRENPYYDPEKAFT